MNAGRRGLTNAGEDEVNRNQRISRADRKVDLSDQDMCHQNYNGDLSSFTNGSYYEHCECTRSVTGVTNQGAWKRIAPMFH
jgi:hypothetical protein